MIFRNPMSHPALERAQPLSPRAATQDPQQRPHPRPILVGVDGTALSAVALEWAVVRVGAGHTSLRIVHAFRFPIVFDPFGVTFWWDDTRAVAVAQRVVDEAVSHARAQDPELQISTKLSATSPAAAIVREGRGAELIVLGRSQPRRRLGRLTGTVNAQVVRQARGRVVIVDLHNEVLA
jgi:nucleotide-binding universal stress UspA family protein